MENKLCRYKINFYWKDRKTSYFEAANSINNVFISFASLDNIFKEMVHIGNSEKENILLTYPILSISVSEYAKILFDENKEWLKKMYPKISHDIHFNGHYGIPIIIRTIGEQLKVIKFDIGIGIINGYSSIIVDFPRDFERDFDWYKSILATLINIFKPDYGGLYPIIIQKLEPPKITGGWISYFAETMNLPNSTFADCVKLSVSENKYMYAIEDQHIIQKNEEQYKKLENIVLKFKELNIQE